MITRIRRRSFYGRFTGICYITVQPTLNRLPIMHAMSIWRCAGDLAGNGDLSKFGRQPDGTRWQTGSKQISLLPDPWQQYRCQPGCRQLVAMLYRESMRQKVL